MNKKHSLPKPAAINRARQLDPTQPVYHRSRGAAPEQAEQQATQARATFEHQARTGSSGKTGDKSSK